MNGIHYRKLPGASGVLLKSKLWLGPDHVLHVRRSLFSEEYRRYYFRDIQAIVMVEKDSLALYLYALAGLLAVWAGVLLYTRHWVAAAMGGIVTGSVALLGWNYPDCICALRTAVSNEVLRPLGRLRYARRSIALLRAAVEEAQGAWSADAQLPQAGGAAREEMAMAPAIPLRHYAGGVHVWLFATMLLAAACSAFEAFHRSTALAVVDSALALGIIALVILAAIKQRRTNLPRAIRRVAMASVVWIAISFVMGTILAVMLMASIDLRHPDQRAMERHPAYIAARWGGVAAYGILGSIGLTLTLLHRRSLRVPPPLTLVT
ncbi:MAG: hypothetical protein M3O35_10620 [Acidobacteriota bacterium]|nr:hypothetical protein [Acidobacteriota bacterium]